MINPFDEHDQFTCPRCGSHEFGPTFVPNTVRCNGFLATRHCDYTYCRKTEPAGCSGYGSPALDKGVVWLDGAGKLVSYCPCCKKHHADADADPAIEALIEALDLIEQTLDIGVDGAPCPYCMALYRFVGADHSRDCEGALFLRKHGRKVRFQGEP